MNEVEYIGANELVFNNDNENGIYSGGFNINSIMMKAGMSPILTVNNQSGGTNKVSDLFDNLVIPNWALSYRMTGGDYKEKPEDLNERLNEDINEDTNEEMDDDLHDKLLGLVREHENKLTKSDKNKKTRKQKTNSKKGGTKRKKL
jgi:hypothetical protein